MELTPIHIRKLNELAGRGLERAAGALGAVAGPASALALSDWHLRPLAEARRRMAARKRREVSAVRLAFSGPLAGSAALLFFEDSAARLVALVTGTAAGDAALDSIRAGTLAEVGGLVLCGALRPLALLFDSPLAFSLPHYVRTTPEKLLDFPGAPAEAAVLSSRVRWTLRAQHVQGDLCIQTDRRDIEALASALGCRAAPHCQHA